MLHPYLINISVICGLCRKMRHITCLQPNPWDMHTCFCSFVCNKTAFTFCTYIVNCESQVHCLRSAEYYGILYIRISKMMCRMCWRFPLQNNIKMINSGILFDQWPMFHTAFKTFYVNISRWYQQIRFSYTYANFVRTCSSDGFVLKWGLWNLIDWKVYLSRNIENKIRPKGLLCCYTVFIGYECTDHK